MTRRARVWPGTVVLALVLAISGAHAGPAPADDIGPIEKKRITVGFFIPNFGTHGPLLVGIDKSYYRDEGFDSVQVVSSEHVREGVAAGSLDFAISVLGTNVDAIQNGFPLRMIAGWHNYERHYIAVRREIGSARDLDGKPVLLQGTPGDPRLALRQQFMREAGWDLGGVRPNYVTAPGGSDAWVRLFLEGRVMVTYFFARHKQTIEQAGHRVIVLKRLEWPNNQVIATEAYLTKNPNTAARFLRATLKAMKFWKDPANRDYVLALVERQGFRVTQADRDTFVESYVDQYDADMALLETGVALHLKTIGVGEYPRFERMINLFYLKKAWRSLGIKPRS